jgi:hypothetical protein
MESYAICACRIAIQFASRVKSVLVQVLTIFFGVVTRKVDSQ